MSGFEVAGVILGAIPLIISALEHYKDGKGAAATFVKWRGLLDTLIFRLKLQRTFFYLQILELLREAGVREAIERPDLSESECIQLLRGVKAEANLEEHLGPLYPAFTDVLGRYEACLCAILSKIGHIQRLPQHQRCDLAQIVAANTPGADGQFCFRERLVFTIERRSLKTLLDELTEERLSLKAIIKGIRTQREFAAREPSHEALRIASIFSQVQAGAQALYSAMSQGCTCRCIDPHQVMMRLDNRLPQQRQKAIMAIRKNQGTTFSLIFTLEGSLQEAVVEAALADEMDIASASLACSTAPVIKLSPALSTQTTLIQTTRVTDICRTAREARVRGRKLQLQLASYTLSTIDNASERCRKFAGSPNLESLLRQGAQDEDSRMTPKQRTLLALDVAAAIPQLRETTWLSQAWDKRAIKFLVTHAAMATEGPFVEHALGGGRNAFATATGPDPKAALLELAILLMEIWHQRTLEDWATNAGSVGVFSSDERRIAATRWLEATSDRLPLHHLTAVEQCLAICSGRLRAWRDDEFLRQYCENVIKPLQESCKAW